MKERLKVSGFVKVWVLYAGRTVQIEAPNVVTFAGQEIFARLLADDPTVIGITHMAIGTSPTLATKSQTELQGSEVQREDVVVQANGNVLIITAEFPESVRADTVAIAEFGLFNSGAIGTMIARWTSVPFTVVPEAVIKVEWTLRIGEADE